MKVTISDEMAKKLAVDAKFHYRSPTQQLECILKERYSDKVPEVSTNGAEDNEVISHLDHTKKVW